MLPWSRPAVKDQPQPAQTSSPDFLANHHRRSSSNLAQSAGNTSNPKSNASKRRNKNREEDREAEEVARDNDPWEDGSDDEAAVAALSSPHKLGSLSILSNSTSTSPTEPNSRLPPSSPASTALAAVASTSSSWSAYNPFSVIAPAPKPITSSIPSPIAGPEAVAAALAGSTIAGAPVASRTVSYLATASKVQEEADKAVEGEERARRSLEKGKEKAGVETEEQGAPPVDAQMMRRGSSYQMDLWRQAIKPDVEELVKDPVSVLSRPSLGSPTANPVPSSPTAASLLSHRVSISSISGPDPEAEDDDDDPAAGYVQLNATNISSGGPEIVEFNKEEDPEENGEKGRERRRRRKFVECLGAENVDLANLRSLAWAGIPNELRPMAWQLLLGYLPAPSSRRVPTLARKRQEYADAVRLAFSRGAKGLDGPIWHQISIDVPRTNPGIRLWQGEGTQRSLERILYVWAIRHPASGYVQGINDLVTPFFQVFLSSYIDVDPETYDVSALPASVLEALEADSFWCLSKLLDGIQDNYIFAQPGIQRQVARMKELCSRVDAPLAHHLEENSVEFIQFAFRWMNCLLMREMSVKNIVRMWDTYLAEGGDAFSEFHLYVCLAFLVKWSDQLRGMDFQSIIMFLQSLPTQDWTDKNTELLLSEAFMWSRTFEAR